MDCKSLNKLFRELVYPSEPNEWDIEDALADLEDMDDDRQQNLLQAIPIIWPISHSLAFSFLKEGARLSQGFDKVRLAEWLRRILYHYEEGGLKKAREYMADPDPGLVDGTIHTNEVALDNHLGRLHAFAKGVSGLDLDIQQSSLIYTDTNSLFLPARVDFFKDSKDNLLYYKLVIGILSCCILQGSFGRHRFVHEKRPNGLDSSFSVADAADYFSLFGVPHCAQDIYQIIEVYRGFNFLSREFPGLLQETERIRRQLWQMREDHEFKAENELESFFALAVLPEERVASRDHPFAALLEQQNDLNRADRIHHEIYQLVITKQGDPGPFSFFPFVDNFNFVETEQARETRIEENVKKFPTVLANFLQKSPQTAVEEITAEISSNQADSARLLALLGNHKKENSPTKKKSQNINNSPVEIPAELKELISRIKADLGKLPESYISAAFGLGGKGRAVGEAAANPEGHQVFEFLPYDEWDYRRHGYRKNWCSLRERPLNKLRSDFYKRTMKKHRGPLLKIRRQFEMMNTQEHFARRRRHGDDLDLDALIDSLGDQRAGLAPSEKLFVRLIRNERSISTLFLVDMSNSTQGWVGTAIKEALVLICEAMEVVGDKYGIYGFSGMRRMRSEVYKIKDVNEPYHIEVKQRLAAIGPKEYTRMGPPIRHMIKQFKGVETKSRLLLILSDGKPEDYDDYKGQYAIEDTRKALAEARGNGIHPYCITIDQEAHDYLEHLFGRGNYTYVKNIEQLPSRLTDIYRLLTR